MTKAELIGEVAKRSGLRKSDVKRVLEAFEGAVVDALEKEEDVTIIGFGTFKLSKRSERKGRNPQTGEVITIPERKTPVFKFSSKVKKLFA